MGVRMGREMKKSKCIVVQMKVVCLLDFVRVFSSSFPFFFSPFDFALTMTIVTMMASFDFPHFGAFFFFLFYEISLGFGICCFWSYIRLAITHVVFFYLHLIGFLPSFRYFISSIFNTQRTQLLYHEDNRRFRRSFIRDFECDFLCSAPRIEFNLSSFSATLYCCIFNRMGTSENLPPELYSAILNHIPINVLQQSALSLTRALPHSPIPQHHLFKHIRLQRSNQPFLLYLRLRQHDYEQIKEVMRVFSLETWTVDADVTVNLLTLLRDVPKLRLWIGPSFAPEHLEEIFERPRDKLEHLELRFRP